MHDGAIIRLRRYGREGATRIVVSHGNGLAINAYAPFWLPLADNYDVFVFDMRNHGENPAHTREAHIMESFFSDIGEVFETIRVSFGPAPTFGAFHSLSAIASLEQTLRVKLPWDGLCVFDPPIMPPIGHPLHNIQHADMERHAQRAELRHFIYNSPDEFAAQLRCHPAFGRWLPEAPDLLALHTLRPMPDGRWVLRCPPKFEAQVFRANDDPSLFHRLRDFPVPLRIVAADPDSRYSIPAAATAKAAHEAMGVDYVMIPDTTHFLQFEEPRACREALLAFVRQPGSS